MGSSARTPLIQATSEYEMIINRNQEVSFETGTGDHASERDRRVQAAEAVLGVVAQAQARFVAGARDIVGAGALSRYHH